MLIAGEVVLRVRWMREGRATQDAVAENNAGAIVEEQLPGCTVYRTKDALQRL